MRTGTGDRPCTTMTYFDLAKLDGMKDRLTQADIEEGVRKGCLYSPIALVLSRMFPQFASIGVDNEHAEIYDNNDGTVLLKLVLSHDLRDSILNKFDGCHRVAPLFIIIRRIGTLWMLCKTYENETPLTYPAIPESIEVFVTYADDTPFGEQWSASISEIGKVEHYIDPRGDHYFTMEEVYAKGVRRLHLSAGHEIEISLD